MLDRKMKLIALILILLLPGLLIGKAAYDRTQGQVWLVNIEGYDPVDVLRGHYLRFKYDWNLASKDAHCFAGKPCCLCLNESKPGSNVNPKAAVMECGAPEARQCKSVITGKRGRNDALNGGQEYFIPEARAHELDTRLRQSKGDFQMEIAVPHHGGPAIIKGLYLDQKALEQR